MKQYRAEAVAVAAASLVVYRARSNTPRVLDCCQNPGVGPLYINNKLQFETLVRIVLHECSAVCEFVVFIVLTLIRYLITSTVRLTSTEILQDKISQLSLISRIHGFIATPN